MLESPNSLGSGESSAKANLPRWRIGFWMACGVSVRFQIVNLGVHHHQRNKSDMGHSLVGPVV